MKFTMSVEHSKKREEERKKKGKGQVDSLDIAGAGWSTINMHLVCTYIFHLQEWWIDIEYDEECIELWRGHDWETKSNIRYCHSIVSISTYRYLILAKADTIALVGQVAEIFRHKIAILRIHKVNFVKLNLTMIAQYFSKTKSVIDPIFFDYFLILLFLRCLKWKKERDDKNYNLYPLFLSLSLSASHYTQYVIHHSCRSMRFFVQICQFFLLLY